MFLLPGFIQIGFIIGFTEDSFKTPGVLFIVGE